jgi:hypothetical protein
MYIKDNYAKFNVQQLSDIPMNLHCVGLGFQLLENFNFLY